MVLTVLHGIFVIADYIVDANNVTDVVHEVQLSFSYPKYTEETVFNYYIEDIQVFGVNMSFISLSEVKKIYIS